MNDSRWKRRTLFIIVAVLGVAATMLLPAYEQLRFELFSEDGLLLVRKDTDLIYINPGTESRLRLYPEGILQKFATFQIETSEPGDIFPPIYLQEGCWIDSLEGAMYGWRTFYVNPRLRDAESMIRYMWSTDEDSPEQIREVHRIAGESYIYLGYAVQGIDDVRALADARFSEPEFDPDLDIVTPTRTLYRLRVDVEQYLAPDGADDAELSRIRGEIPVYIERANEALGHPMDMIHVLYLDGTITKLPFGTQFPATQEFLDALFPPQQ